MKKYLIAASAVFVLAACESNIEEPPVITYETVGLTDRIEISDVESYPYPDDIGEVAFVARYHGYGGSGSTLDAEGEDARIMLRTPFDREGITLVLPENPPQELLRGIASDFPAGFDISDPEAQTVSCVEIACDVSEEHGFYKFFHRYLSLPNVYTYYELKYIYCDRAATVTGSGVDWWGNPTIYELSLGKGWNMIVEKTVSNGTGQNRTVTHLMPAGIKWEQDMWIGGR